MKQQMQSHRFFTLDGVRDITKVKEISSRFFFSIFFFFLLLVIFFVFFSFALIYLQEHFCEFFFLPFHTFSFLVSLICLHLFEFLPFFFCGHLNFYIVKFFIFILIEINRNGIDGIRTWYATLHFFKKLNSFLKTVFHVPFLFFIPLIRPSICFFLYKVVFSFLFFLLRLTLIH